MRTWTIEAGDRYKRKGLYHDDNHSKVFDRNNYVGRHLVVKPGRFKAPPK